MCKKNIRKSYINLNLEFPDQKSGNRFISFTKMLSFFFDII